MGKRIFTVLIILVATGCVKTEILEGPEKTKTITVWDSDLKLHYDRLTDNGRRKKVEDQIVEGTGLEEESPEEAVGEEVQTGEVPEVAWSQIEEGIARDLRDKQVMDEEESKRIREADEIEVKKTEKKEGSGGGKWLIVLAGLVFFGGCFTSMKRRGK